MHILYIQNTLEFLTKYPMVNHNITAVIGVIAPRIADAVSQKLTANFLPKIPDDY